MGGVHGIDDDADAKESLSMAVHPDTKFESAAKFSIPAA